MLKHQSSRRFPLVAFLIIVVGALTIGPVVMLVIGSFSEGIGAIGKFTTDKPSLLTPIPRFPKRFSTQSSSPWGPRVSQRP